MEQSRLVYEDATHQLGSFLELVSAQLEGFNIRPEHPLDKVRNPAGGIEEILETFKPSKCLKTANKVRSSSSVSPSQSKTCTVTHVKTGYIKSSHKGSEKSMGRKRGQTKREDLEHPSRTGSIDLSVPYDENRKYKDKQWASDKALARNGQRELYQRKTRLERMNGKVNKCLSMDKRTGKFSVNKSTKYRDQNYPEPLSATIIGIHGIWSLRNY